MNGRKIDQEGRYSYYPGTTVIAEISKHDHTFWRKIQQIILQAEVVNNYYTPLPYDSYHMTAIRLFNQAEYTGNNWQKFIISQQFFFKNIANYLQENQFLPQITIEKLNMAETLNLQVSIPKQQEELILKTANCFNIATKIPDPFHITLAYAYQVLNAELKKNMYSHINKSLNKLLAVHGNTFTLNAPQLYYYNDMTHFSLWHGKNYPFAKK
ncbi:Uncharacterized protein conserved in bacteria [Legionella beliardensis]|uniref:Uncharacterized protein conserved in bacteria n=1 Tax=Legionella beliardensis TaxID=91822 RepID=A0A378I256_9GAMM|nr:DUF1868 domain-containing protein [Legionella beliardensis]STX29032.1 Uncharacterized protein conserved in bacteria [Legionella beliardensis]